MEAMKNQLGDRVRLAHPGTPVSWRVTINEVCIDGVQSPATLDCPSPLTCTMLYSPHICRLPPGIDDFHWLSMQKAFTIPLNRQSMSSHILALMG